MQLFILKSKIGNVKQKYVKINIKKKVLNCKLKKVKNKINIMSLI